MLDTLLLGRPGTTQVLIIVLAIILLFGATKIPELARSMGRAKGEFEKGLREGEEEAQKAKKAKKDKAGKGPEPDGTESSDATGDAPAGDEDEEAGEANGGDTGRSSAANASNGDARASGSKA